MKKLFSTIFLLCLCLGMVSCAPDEPEISYESEKISNIQTGTVFPFNDVFDKGIQSSIKSNINCKKIEICGANYSGEYVCTNHQPLKNLNVDLYKNNEEGIEFAISEKNGQLRFFHQKNIKYDYEEERALDKDLMIIAQKIAKKYLTDTSLYEICVDYLYEHFSTNEMHYGKSFLFIKKVQGYYTNDYLYVQITNSGTIEYLSIGQIGAFNKCATLNDDKISESLHCAIEKECEIKGVKMIDKMFYRKSLFLDEKTDKIVLLSSVWVNSKSLDGVQKADDFSFVTFVS